MTHAVERRLEPAAQRADGGLDPPRPAGLARLAGDAMRCSSPWLALFLLPFYWMVVSALKSNNEIFARAAPVVAGSRALGELRDHHRLPGTFRTSACSATASSTPAR